MAQFKRIEPSALFARSFTTLRQFDRDLLQLLSQLMTSLSNMFDRGITLSENTETQQIDYVTNGVPNTEDTVPHTLEKVPSGFLVVGTDKAAHIYKSATAFTATNVYLKSDVATVAARIIVF